MLFRSLLETDTPFVRPAGYEGERNTSRTMTEVAELIADLKGMSTEEVVRAVQANAHAFYGV